jgi:hypothetical protein
MPICVFGLMPLISLTNKDFDNNVNNLLAYLFSSAQYKTRELK